MAALFGFVFILSANSLNSIGGPAQPVAWIMPNLAKRSRRERNPSAWIRNIWATQVCVQTALHPRASGERRLSVHAYQ